MEHKKYTDVLEIIDDFNKSPMEYIKRINTEKNIMVSSLTKTEEYLALQLLKLSEGQKEAIDDLTFRLDTVNSQIINEIKDKILLNDYALEIRLLPIKRIGIYVPKAMPSSAYTFLSAAKAAGVNDIVLFIAQDEKGDIDPLTIYVAKKYNAQIVGGPARIGFPTLAFGIDKIEKCDMICGPCGENMNIIKNVCGLVGHVAIDMSAGASDLTIITDREDHWEQIYFDLLSQLEHGKDSTSQLIIVGDRVKKSFINSKRFTSLKNVANISVIYVASSDEAIELVYTRPPETLEVFSDDLGKFESCYRFCGVVYTNTSSTLGDYGVIGRGCADPTGGFAKGQSGISPLRFLKVVAVVSDKKLTPKDIDSAKILAQYEGLSSHERVLNNFQNSKIVVSG
jgi:histidinol dehydrogenase